ncbi:MAG TPA: RnfH family protein [Gammaproteobacteria bacterium]|nr:RnfH family protein [Gammaproteobacteria bacterium]
MLWGIIMKVEVAYASPEEQVLLETEVPEGATIEDAIRESGILEWFPEISLETNKVGIFGHAESLDTPLRERDRVEIYRPITCDPKEVRRQRAKKKKPPVRTA